jgi:hypothetical protein
MQRPVNDEPACIKGESINWGHLRVTRKNVWTRVDMNAFVWTFMWTSTTHGVLSSPLDESAFRPRS